MAKTEIEILNKYFPNGIKCEDDRVGIIRAMAEYTYQFQSSPKWVRADVLPKKKKFYNCRIDGEHPVVYWIDGENVVLHDDIMDKKFVRDHVEYLDETPGNVSPQAAVVAEEKFFTTDEVWRMYSEDPAYGHKSYKEFAEENGWVMVRLKAAPTPTEEQDKEVKEDENYLKNVKAVLMTIGAIKGDIVLDAKSWLDYKETGYTAVQAVKEDLGNFYGKRFPFIQWSKVAENLKLLK